METFARAAIIRPDNITGEFDLPFPQLLLSFSQIIFFGFQLLDDLLWDLKCFFPHLIYKLNNVANPVVLRHQRNLEIYDNYHLFMKRSQIVFSFRQGSAQLRQVRAFSDSVKKVIWNSNGFQCIVAFCSWRKENIVT